MTKKRPQVQVLRRVLLPALIDGHHPLLVVFRIQGPQGWFRLCVVSVNWGRGYAPGVFRRAVMEVLDATDERQYVVLLIQELDEADAAPERRVFIAEMEPGTTLTPGPPLPGRETIAVSPGVPVRWKRRVVTMEAGLDLKPPAPAGTGPRRFFVSCVSEMEGLTIGFGDQHPHKIPDKASVLKKASVVRARRHGVEVTREEVALLANICDLVIYGGDMNDTNYPKVHPREHVAFERGLDTIRYVVA
jgi:hypothetical protein